MAKVLVSFKQKEMELFNLVKAQGDQSNFIKEALKFYLGHRNSSTITVKDDFSTPKNDEILDILNI